MLDYHLNWELALKVSGEVNRTWDQKEAHTGTQMWSGLHPGSDLGRWSCGLCLPRVALLLRGYFLQALSWPRGGGWRMMCDMPSRRNHSWECQRTQRESTKKPDPCVSLQVETNGGEHGHLCRNFSCIPQKQRGAKSVPVGLSSLNTRPLKQNEKRKLCRKATAATVKPRKNLVLKPNSF